jgi:hypothetical protein
MITGLNRQIGAAAFAACVSLTLAGCAAAQDVVDGAQGQIDNAQERIDSASAIANTAKAKVDATAVLGAVVSFRAKNVGSPGLWPQVSVGADGNYQVDDESVRATAPEPGVELFPGEDSLDFCVEITFAGDGVVSTTPTSPLPSESPCS